MLSNIREAFDKVRLAIKTVFAWLGDKWHQFEMWVATWAPGFKTKTVAFLGMVGEGAAAIQEYVSGIPLDTWITGTQRAIVFAVLFTLAFWFKRLADKFKVE